MQTLKEALINKNNLDKASASAWPNPYKISKKDLIGKIKDWPIEIVTLAIKCFLEQSPYWDPLKQIQSKGIFCSFDWHNTIEGYDFWNEIYKKNFSEFYKIYTPKKLENRLKR